ncbi:Phosphatidate cytidylyltransferase [Dyadobacter sp. CECT 9623]|jgi:phosphatidate cytidylyltransferase|uniref:Phosphatidate cytidylyltransferase n=1 Tax=Dyadobacter linearis TaxID=2823330 RepID=A0ABM8UT47_9BACT|nr:phosphatidate cytidylyltransferase [Dyadobacter sp. CECT 9623]CAG5070867.1 Phosphatidate cytidylyltransferase [Dyadobacter sp. CECT 9623]
MKTRLSKLSNLQQRTITALAGVFVIIGCILYNELTFLLLFCTISSLTQLEFYKLLGLDGNQPLTYYGTFCGTVMMLLAYLIEQDIVPFENYFIISPLLSMIFFIKLYKKNDLKPFTNIGFTFLGIIYVALPFALIIVMAMRGGRYNYEIVLGSLLILWASDIGGYFAGTNFGKRKLFERISPKKSWEGAVGSAVFAAFIAFALGHYFRTFEPWKWYCIGAIIVVVGTYGDLVESLFKRSIAIKDSGSSIPGHGGFLDRFDGLLLSAPFIVTFLKLFS